MVATTMTQAGRRRTLCTRGAAERPRRRPTPTAPMSARSSVLFLLGALVVFGAPALLVATRYPGWDTWTMYGVAAVLVVAGLASIAPRSHAAGRRTVVRHYEPKQR